MGATISKRISGFQLKSNRQTPSAFRVMVKLDDKETIERLQRLRRSIRMSDAKVSDLLRKTDRGVVLEEELRGIEKEIEETTAALAKQEIAAHAYLGEQVLALESLLSDLRQYLAGLQSSRQEVEEVEKVEAKCRTETARLMALVQERAKGLQDMRNKLQDQSLIRPARRPRVFPEFQRLRSLKASMMGELTDEEKMKAVLQEAWRFQSIRHYGYYCE